jgi:hypothetical protein
MVTIDLCTYDSLQFLINPIGGCELPTKCTSCNNINQHDSNDDCNVSKTFIAFSRFCAKFIILSLIACWHVVPPLLVYLDLTDMV